MIRGETMFGKMCRVRIRGSLAPDARADSAYTSCRAIMTELRATRATRGPNTIVNAMTIKQPLAPALDHFFNHQTHHRGQLHALLTAIGGRDFAPSLDLILFQRKTGAGGIVQRV